MTVGGPELSRLVLAISILPGKPEWSDDMALIYGIGLRSVPDEAADALTVAIAERCTWRPTPAEVLTLYRELTEQTGSSVAEVMTEITGMIGAYGAMAAPHPDHPDRWPMLRALGAPPTLSDAAQRVVSAWGGWETLANDPNPSGVFRGQLRRMVEHVVANSPDVGMERLRIEYAAQLVKALPDVEDLALIEGAA